MIDQDKMRALAAELRKGSGGHYKWYAMGRDETSYFMDFDWGYDADRWFADQQRSRAAWIKQEGVHLVKKLFQTELETNAAAAADAIDLLLAEVEAAAADKRDAERYRALRDFGKDGVKMKPPVEHVHAMIYSHMVGAIPASRVARGDELDRAIDAAMNVQK